MANDSATFMIEDARLIWRNFSGTETQFKPAGTPTFNVVLDKALADQMAADGWNVKCKPPQEEDDEEFCYIEVTLGFKVRPPRIVMITNDGNTRTNLNQDTVGILDWADIRQADLIARAYEWEVGGKSGKKAYLQSLFVHVEEDALEKKYAVANVPTDEG